MKSYLVLAIYLLFSAGFVNAQRGSIKGRIRDAKTLQPLPFASVYLNFTTKGAYAKENGEFSLDDLPLGLSELVVSYAGFQSYQTKILIKDSLVQFLDIKLKSLTLKEVMVTSKKDEKWLNQLARFKTLFLGVSPLSVQCNLINPWSLEFNESNDVFKAESATPLIIENLSLGYQISYQLKKFEVKANNYTISGVVWFKEIPSIDPKLDKMWAEKRRDIYLGSSKHLLRSILDQRTIQDGFDLYEDKSGIPDVIRLSNFLSNVNKSIIPMIMENRVKKGVNNQNIIQFPERTEVHYLKKSAPPKIYRNITAPISWIEVKGGSLTINDQGIALNPSVMVVSGAMSEARVSELLPNNYEPKNENDTDNEKGKKQISTLTYLFEKPYIHTNKSCYHINETIWFKAYFNYYAPAYKDSLSRVLYVDLIDIKQKLVTTKIFPVDSNGMVIGNFPLYSFLSGDYQLRAYTRWMLNFNKSLIFLKTIKILDDDADVYEITSSNILFKSEYLEIETDKEEYQVGETIDIGLQAKDSYNYPIKSDLSISVSKSKYSILEDQRLNITSAFPIAKDLLLDSLPKGTLHTIQYGIGIKGQFISNGRRKKQKQAVLIFAQQNSDDLFKITTEADGSFYLPSLQLFDSAKLSVQGLSVRGRKAGRVVLDSINISPWPETFAPLKIEEIKIENRPYTMDSSTSMKSIILDEVIVKDTKLKVVRGSAVHLQADQTISGEILRAADNGDLLSILQSRVSGLRVVAFQDGGGIPRKIIKFGGINNFDRSPANQEPLVMIDGTIINATSDETAAEQISRMSASSIDSVQFIRFGGGAAYGARGANGVISIYMNYLTPPKQRNSELVDRTKFQLLNTRGYSSIKHFKTLNTSEAMKLDNRTTIYWNPKVMTGGEFPEVISLTAPNNIGLYTIIVEGLTSEGKAVRATKMIAIKIQP